MPPPFMLSMTDPISGVRLPCRLRRCCAGPRGLGLAAKPQRAFPGCRELPQRGCPGHQRQEGARRRRQEGRPPASRHCHRRSRPLRVRGCRCPAQGWTAGGQHPQVGYGRDRQGRAFQCVFLPLLQKFIYRFADDVEQRRSLTVISLSTASILPARYPTSVSIMGSVNTATSVS